MINMQSISEMHKQFAAHVSAAGLTAECLSDGDLNAKIVVIAEAPGPREVELKTPLIGGSGKLLWDKLAKFDIRRRDCYITNVVKKQLVFSDKKNKQSISKNELEHWQALLEWELSQLPNAKYLILLGGVALQSVVGHTGIDAWRGSLIEDVPYGKHGRTYHCLVAHNPANIIRKPMLEPVFMLDMSKLQMHLQGAWKPHNIQAYYDPTPREAVQWCDKMIQEGKPVSFDIEVISNETACVGLANDPHVGMCINFRTRDSNRWSIADELLVRTSIQRVLRHHRTQLVAQNGSFDAGWLWYKDRIKCKPIWMDTLLGHHTLHPIWPHGLGFLTTQYTTHPYYKDDIDKWRDGEDISTFWEYNVKDVCITYAAAMKIEASLKQQGLHQFFHEMVMPRQQYLVAATVLGNRIDTAMKERLTIQYRGMVEELRRDFVKKAQIATGFGDDYIPNPNSPVQMGELFFRKLRLVGKTTSTDEANRIAMIESPHTNEDARLMLIAHGKFKEEHKLLSTYIESGVDEDMRMRSEYKQYGTAFVPGRLSSSGTLWGSGMNLQNQPEVLRGMFIADEGYVYVYFDGAQAEARIVGWEAEIVEWKHQFEMARLHPGSYDAHCALASEMFNIPYDQVPKYDWDDTTKQHTIRYTAKRCRHGLNYRMQPPRLAATLGCTLREAERLWHLYHRATPQLRQWWERILHEVRTTRQLWTCLGRRIEFLGSRLDESMMDSIIAFKPQSTLGDMICDVQMRSQADDKWPRDARIPFNNHDSLTAMCREKDVMTVATIMKKYAERPLIIKGDPLIIPSDWKVSVPDEHGVHRWNNMKKLKLAA
jgi:uracil-DNA glycosylase family 4